MCCRCNSPSGACYHVGPCSFCPTHSMYIGDPLSPVPQPYIPPITIPHVPLTPQQVQDLFKSPRSGHEILEEILKELKKIRSILEHE